MNECCILSGPLDAPYNFSITISKTSFMLSWGVPFSLNVTDWSPDIFYYTLCINITIYGCKTIPSDPDCTFPRICTSLVDFTDPSHTNGGQHETVTEGGGSLLFTFFAINGAGNGAKANYTLRQETGLCSPWIDHVTMLHDITEMYMLLVLSSNFISAFYNSQTYCIIFLICIFLGFIYRSKQCCSM